MVSSPVNGQDLGIVCLSGKRRGVARCDNVISWACTADYGDSLLLGEGTADGIIYQGCCDGFPAPSSHAEKQKGLVCIVYPNPVAKLMEISVIAQNLVVMWLLQSRIRFTGLL
ncbi:hypothetical protein MLD38_001881 [Melastoma candidum]|uniref:Uncharacterized protein n=1 Tax=Melastoma candidum TaxID=119954 RepID=A0ACB9SER5_9MYRT|nr:hypothetical protein MLD38_001881 [Melastoma candidum]